MQHIQLIIALLICTLNQPLLHRDENVREQSNRLTIFASSYNHQHAENNHHWDIGIENLTTRANVWFYHLHNTRLTKRYNVISFNRTVLRALLMVCGDIALNPGPTKNPCGTCYKPVARHHRAILCEACLYWFHIKCENISPNDYIKLGECTEPWICSTCSNFHFTDSYFEISCDNISGLDSSSCSQDNSFPIVSPFAELREIRQKHPKKFITAHLNINSLKSKFVEIEELLHDKIVDLLFISETKLDATFRNSIFDSKGYKLERADRNVHGGGIACYIRNDIPSRRRTDLESTALESIVYEVTLNKTKWCFICSYRPPGSDENVYLDILGRLIDKCISLYDRYAIIGDLNLDLSSETKGKPLKEFCELYDLQNIIKDPTCFMKNCNPSLLDVFLTNSKKQCIRTLNFATGISDCHNMISTVINITIPNMEKQKISYRSYRNFNYEDFVNDLNKIPVPEVVAERDQDLINKNYNSFELAFNEVIDKHIPVKQTYVKNEQLPYMNRQLRKAIYAKKMAYHKYLKHKNPRLWEDYRIKRNFVNKLKKKSLNNYFLERCTGGAKNENFWGTIKPYFSKKTKGEKTKITLNENNEIISTEHEVADIFNDFYINVAKDIGKDCTFDPENHPSINHIKMNCSTTSTFNFQPTDSGTVSKLINKFNSKKATGVDKISVKVLKLGGIHIQPHLTNLINSTISTCIFPDRLKQAQVTPVYKKNDPQTKSNFRPVSILPIPSKLFEKILATQLSDYFETVFNKFLCAFRKGYGCQTTILKLLEDWKHALDKNHYVAAILMDLSKAFDCLPHDILLCKLSSYGLSDEAVKLMTSYLTDRKQQVKVGDKVSAWAEIQKGVPQGSILGPLLFNVFINDIFYFISDSILYNYADDNTLSFHSPDFNHLIKVLQRESDVLLDWFKINGMQANPDKFQAIAVGKRTFNENPTFNIGNASISCDESVKLLGVDIDFNLSFDKHISNVCSKATQQLNVLKRLGRNLCHLSKITIFYTFILSNFNFCPLSWHFCSKRNTERIERVQERALRFVYDDYSSRYEALLKRAGLPTLHVRRLRTMATETFKILNELSPSVLSDLIIKKETKYSFRYKNILDIPHVRTSRFGKSSFRYAAPVLWNSLPAEIREAGSFQQFRRMLSFWDGGSCKCIACNNC